MKLRDNRMRILFIPQRALKMFRLSRLLFTLVFFLFGLQTASSQDNSADGLDQVSISDWRKKYQLLGITHQPIGKTITIEGIAEWVNRTKFDNGLKLHVQRIEGRPTQENIRLDVSRLDQTQPLSDIFKSNQTYRLIGYETGAFVGLPKGAKQQVLCAIPPFHFSHEFVFVQATPIDAIRYAPSDFVDTTAAMQGAAVSLEGQSWIRSSDWRLLVNSSSPWPDWMEGKEVEAYGLVHRMKQPDAYQIENAETRMVHLDDQVGHEVCLLGKTCYEETYSGSYLWFLDYRGQDVYLDKTDKLPAWSDSNFGKLAIITGTLKRAQRPDLKHVGSKPKPELKTYFVVHATAWSPVNRQPLFPEVEGCFGSLVSDFSDH